MKGNNLAQLRDAACLSQQDLADAVNSQAAQHGRHGVHVTARSVSRWERGANTPTPEHRRLLADALGVKPQALGFGVPQQRQPDPEPLEDFMGAELPDLDPRVRTSQDEWLRTRRALNGRRSNLARHVAQVYDPAHRIGDTGLIAHPGWIPDLPVDLAAVKLDLDEHAIDPEVDGTEPESGHVRPRMTLVRRFPRYTHAIRDLAHPRLFENRFSWRLTDVAWEGDSGRMTYGPTTYFAAVDVCEAVAHETAYVAFDGDGSVRPEQLTLRDLPFRKHIGDPFDLARRSLLPATPTLTMRRGLDGQPSFILHRRDSRNVAIAAGLLHVIPSGMFQPSSIVPAAQREDFSLWRNIMREYSEELLGNPEHDGDGSPVDYDDEPFRTLEQARRDGRIRVYCLGLAVDALTLVGEIMCVAVWDDDVFDEVARDFVDSNDEGRVVAERTAFTEQGLASVLRSQRMAPAGAGCLELAWKHRSILLP